MRAYVAAYARPENARDTLRGAPSPWNVLAMMPKEAKAKARRLHASDLDSTAVIVSRIVVALHSPSQHTLWSLHLIWFQKTVLCKGGEKWHKVRRSLTSVELDSDRASQGTRLALTCEYLASYDCMALMFPLILKLCSL